MSDRDWRGFKLGDPPAEPRTAAGRVRGFAKRYRRGTFSGEAVYVLMAEGREWPLLVADLEELAEAAAPEGND